MDHRVKTAALALGACLLASAYAVSVMASSSATATTQYQSSSSDEYLTPAQRNPELPKGLTIVPWRLERRPDRIDLLGDTYSTPGASSQATQQSARKQSRR